MDGAIPRDVFVQLCNQDAQTIATEGGGGEGEAATTTVAKSAPPSLEELKAIAEKKNTDAIQAQKDAGIDWKAVHSCVRWDKPTEEVSKEKHLGEGAKRHGINWTTLEIRQR